MLQEWKNTEQQNEQAAKYMKVNPSVRTICSVIRHIHYATKNEKVKALSLVAIWYAKQVNALLRRNKETKDWDKGWWESMPAPVQQSLTYKPKNFTEKDKVETTKLLSTPTTNTFCDIFVLTHSLVEDKLKVYVLEALWMASRMCKKLGV